MRRVSHSKLLTRKQIQIPHYIIDNTHVPHSPFLICPKAGQVDTTRGREWMNLVFLTLTLISNTHTVWAQNLLATLWSVASSSRWTGIFFFFALLSSFIYTTTGMQSTYTKQARKQTTHDRQHHQFYEVLPVLKKDKRTEWATLRSCSASSSSINTDCYPLYFYFFLFFLRFVTRTG